MSGSRLSRLWAPGAARADLHGSSVGSLPEVIHNKGACRAQSRIIFRAAAGVMYTAAVDGFGSATGSLS